MPHIVLNGNWSLENYWQLFERVERHGEPIIKISTCWLSSDRQQALLDALAVDGGRPRRFLIQIEMKSDNTAVIRLAPASDPERTLGVKRTVILVAESIIQRFPQVSIGANNLEEMLEI